MPKFTSIVAVTAFATLVGATALLAQPPAEPTPAEVCLTNACAAPAGSVVSAVSAKQAAMRGPAPPAPTSPTAFAARFNGNSPVLVRGRMAGVDWGDPYSYVRVTDAEGNLYRVESGAASRLTAEQKAQLQSSVGKDVVVRGYEAFDTSCQGGCLVNGRDVTLADGVKLFAPPGAVNSPSMVLAPRP